MSHTQSTLINQMAAKPEVIPKEEERVKSLPTYHTVATIQVVEDLKTISTHLMHERLASRSSLVTPSGR